MTFLIIQEFVMMTCFWNQNVFCPPVTIQFRAALPMIPALLGLNETTVSDFAFDSFSIT
jgi:hypothetical protein